MAEGVRDVNKLMQMKNEVTAMGTKVDNLLKTVKPNYDANNLYLTDKGKTDLATDMKQIKSEIDKLTKEYAELKKNGTTEVESRTIKNTSPESHSRRDITTSCRLKTEYTVKYTGKMDNIFKQDCNCFQRRFSDRKENRYSNNYGHFSSGYKEESGN